MGFSPPRPPIIIGRNVELLNWYLRQMSAFAIFVNCTLQVFNFNFKMRQLNSEKSRNLRFIYLESNYLFVDSSSFLCLQDQRQTETIGLLQGQLANLTELVGNLTQMVERLDHEVTGCKIM